MQIALLKCKESKNKLPSTTPEYNDGWTEAFSLMEKVLVDLLPSEQLQIVDACTFGMNRKGGNTEDAKAYFSHYFQSKENV